MFNYFRPPHLPQTHVGGSIVSDTVFSLKSFLQFQLILVVLQVCPLKCPYPNLAYFKFLGTPNLPAANMGLWQVGRTEVIEH